MLDKPSCTGARAATAMAPLQYIIVFIVAQLIGTVVCSNIQAGAGYSIDKQQIVQQRCYNATVSSISEQAALIRLETSQTFSKLEHVLRISVTASGNYGAFSADAKANYMRSIEEKDYSISLNYYHYASNIVKVQLLAFGEHALTESARNYYRSANNKYFGLVCGDHYMTSYDQGAFLTTGLTIEFSSANAKTEFIAQVGASFGNIVSAAVSVKTAGTQYNITGSVTLHAFQMGGTPSQLSNILSSSDSGEYYALACSLTTMDKCVKAAGGLLDYAKNKFSNQFSTVNNTGLTPLGLAFTEFSAIKYIGLNPPPSLVTSKVKECRNALFSKLMESEYYQQKLYPFLNKGYPAELDDDFLKKARSVLSKADRNVKILMKRPGGAADCFNFPDECESIKADIDSILHNITADDLKFLEPVKYTLTTRGGTFYPGIDDRNKTKWHYVPDNRPGKERVVWVRNVDLSDIHYIYITQFYSPNHEDAFSLFFYDGKPTVISPDGTITYSGLLQDMKHYETESSIIDMNYKEYKRISPFFFDVYNMTQ